MGSRNLKGSSSDKEVNMPFAEAGDVKLNFDPVKSVFKTFPQSGCQSTQTLQPVKFSWNNLCYLQWMMMGTSFTWELLDTLV